MEPETLFPIPMRAVCIPAGAGRGRRGGRRLPDALAGADPRLRIRCRLALLFGLLAVVAFSLILFDRSDRVYLWMGALFLL